MSQQDLANKLCIKKNIVNDLESRKILKNDKVIRRALNILKIK
jgi:ribosome-binding protein aMBF1 (putative translation factor)